MNTAHKKKCLDVEKKALTSVESPKEHRYHDDDCLIYPSRLGKNALSNWWYLSVYVSGLVQVNNWKALPFEQITDNPDETVHSLFKDISGHITLRILTKPYVAVFIISSDSASTQCITDLKQRLLKTAVSKNPQILNSVDNQQIKELINQVIAGDDPAILNHEQINSINEWLETLEQGDERRRLVKRPFNRRCRIPSIRKTNTTKAAYPSLERITIILLVYRNPSKL
ncbi:unnamed protein product [Haemonchus placei]|uniref:ULD domain-containing protein n=1 Tax=Haemonchus placei TaxID=6290 RepID=A0A0N4VVN6_HAEPC|nr:unnamed protein product [Haemonchus placei]